MARYMRSSRSIQLLLVLLLAVSSRAQPPVFTPPPKPPAKPTPPPAVAPKPVEEPAKAGATDPLEAYVERMRRWPARSARQAALVLAGLGDRARTRLIAGLEDNDWRIQAGSAFALAEMGDTAAIEPLTRAARSESNRASLPELLRAVAAIDPVAGPQVILPFVSHPVAKVRVAARAALPDVLAERFLPEVIVLWKSQKTSVRVSGLTLLTRIPGQEARPEFFDALGDPESQVAIVAARHLSRFPSEEVRTRVLELARRAPNRQSAYAMLSLVMLEDRLQDKLIPEAGPIRDRAQKFLASNQPFYAGTGAVVLANLSFRGGDKTVRQLADDYLCPILLGTVAGGIFFPDYTSLEDLCWAKLAMLTGVDLGQSASRWRAWWKSNREGFIARRELRGLTREELTKARLRLTRIAEDGGITELRLSGDVADLEDERSGGPLVFSGEQLDRLAGLLTECRVFETRGDRARDARLGASLELSIRVPERAMGFSRLHNGSPPEALRPLLSWLDQVHGELAWQRLMPPGTQDRAAFINEQRAFFESETDAARRQARLLSLALVSWPTLDAVNRSLALSVFRAAPTPWVRENRAQLVALLQGEGRLTKAAVGLISVLGHVGDEDARTAVVDAVAASPSPRGDAVLRGYLSGQALSGVVPLMRHDSVRVRALAAESLVRFEGEETVVGILIEGLRDHEARVQDACVRSLEKMRDERVVSMLHAVVDSEEHKAVRMRAIEALGLVGGPQVVARLMTLFREGDRHVRWTVIQALKKAGGRRAVNSLASIVRNPGDVELKKEALDALAALGGPEVAERITQILRKSEEREVEVMAMGCLARVVGGEAVEILRPYVESEDAVVRRMALLTIARLGSPVAAEGLLQLMSKPDGDQAAEAAFQDLSFLVSRNPSPPRRYQTYESWFEANKTEPREEWFLAAARRSVDLISDQVPWLTATELSDQEASVLVTLMRKGDRPMCAAADATLRRVSGLDLRPVGRTEAEAMERANRFERWLSGRPISR